MWNPICMWISSVNGGKMKQFLNILFFLFYLRFVLQTFLIHKAVEDGGRSSLFLFTLSTSSRTFRHLFIVLHL